MSVMSFFSDRFDRITITISACSTRAELSWFLSGIGARIPSQSLFLSQWSAL